METSIALIDLVYSMERLAALYELEDLDRTTAFPDESNHYIRLPARTEEIAAVEKHLQVRLPDDYKEFLAIRNGWKNFSGDYSLLSTTEIRSLAVQQSVAELRKLWHEDEKVQRGIFIYLGHGRQFGFYDYGESANDPCLHFYDIGESIRYDTFTAYLLSEKKALERALYDLGWGTELV